MTDRGGPSLEADRQLRRLRFFTMGYQLVPAGEFVAELESARIDVVVDVRETAWSRKPGFSASQLRRDLSLAGIQYVHAKFAGNPKELRRAAPHHEECLRLYADHLDSNPAILGQLTQLVLDLRPAERICFICYERHPNDCHRSVLFDRWQQALGRSLDLEHLSPDGAPRFIRA